MLRTLETIQEAAVQILGHALHGGATVAGRQLLHLRFSIPQAHEDLEQLGVDAGKAVCRVGGQLRAVTKPELSPHSGATRSKERDASEASPPPDLCAWAGLPVSSFCSIYGVCVGNETTPFSFSRKSKVVSDLVTISSSKQLDRFAECRQKRT